MTHFIKLCAAIAILISPVVATAGSSAAGKPILPAAEVAIFADRVQQDLAARGASIAIVSCMGRDPAQMPNGILYTHVAFWVYAQITLADGSRGQGYRVYNLYQRTDDRTVSDLVQGSPAAFFAGAQRLDTGIIIPKPALQRKLLAVLNSSTYAALHNPRYSVLSNPRNGMFQNCTEHTLDVLMAAVYGTSDPNQIQANIIAYFDPQVISIGGLKRTFATLASEALTTQDHGSVVATTTFGSLARFMQKYGLAAEVYRRTPSTISRF